MSEPALCDVRDGLCTITFNRPEKLNALKLLTAILRPSSSVASTRVAVRNATLAVA